MTLPKTSEKMENLQAEIELSRADMEIAVDGIERCSERLRRLIELKAPYSIVKREIDMIQYRALNVLSIYEALLLLKWIYRDDPVGETEESKESNPVRKCRVCGCTDLHACEGGCHWVEDDLCSSCETEGDTESCQQ